MDECSTVAEEGSCAQIPTLKHSAYTVQVLELEQRNQSLQSELDSTTPTSLIRRNQDPTSWLPRAPARHTLQSHRSPITCVAFHPVFSSLASGSEDTTIKIWDWELGELERTVKGHTKGVLDVDFGGPRGGTLLALSLIHI